MDGVGLHFVGVFAIGSMLVFVVLAMVSSLLWLGVEVFFIGRVLVFIVLDMVW
jgi:hypothetical protein